MFPVVMTKDIRKRKGGKGRRGRSGTASKSGCFCEKDKRQAAAKGSDVFHGRTKEKACESKKRRSMKIANGNKERNQKDRRK